MGRSLSGAFGAESANGIGQGVFNLKAGAAILQDAIVELGPNGKAFPVVCTDYAAVSNISYGTAQTSEASGRIVAQTQVVAGQTPAYYGQAVVQGTDGSIFTFTRSAANTGLTLSKYSAAGALRYQVIVDAGANDYGVHQAFLLSNGNLCVIAHTQLGAIKFAVYTQTLSVVKSLTSLGEAVTSNTSYFSAIPLAEGGFAVVYQQAANQLLSRLVVYDNTGTVTLAPVTIWTRTGTTGNQEHKIARLSNGNIGVAVFSNNSSGSSGLFYGVITTAGAPVQAFTNLHTDLTNSCLPQISVVNGFFCIARYDISTARAWVFNNAGVLQGAGFSAATSSISGNKLSLVNDGTSFWLIWARSSDSQEVLTKLPITGTNYSNTVITTTVSSNYSTYINSFYENGWIVCAFQPPGTSSSMYLFVIDIETAQLINTAATAFGVASTSTNGQYHRIIPGGDFSFIALYDYASTAATHLAVGKYANTAVMGISQSSAVADSLVSCAGVAGGYAANYVKGSPSKTFDHTAANIYGNKGALMSYGAVLKGF